MARTALHVALAVLVLLAGCNGVLGRSGTDTSEPTATPGQTVSYPPGVTDDGVGEALELVGAHQRTTANVSYVSNRTMRVRYPNGTAARQVRTIRHDADRDRYALSQRSSGPRIRLVSNVTVELWANDTVAVGVSKRSGEGTFFALQENFARQATRARHLALFTKLNTTTTGTTTDGPPLVHLLGTDVEESSIHHGVVENVSDVSFSAAVTPAGVVRSYTLRYEGTVDGQEVRVTEEYRLRPDDVTVGRPAWLPDALNETEESR